MFELRSPNSGFETDTESELQPLMDLIEFAILPENYNTIKAQQACRNWVYAGGFAGDKLDSSAAVMFKSQMLRALRREPHDSRLADQYVEARFKLILDEGSRSLTPENYSLLYSFLHLMAQQFNVRLNLV